MRLRVPSKLLSNFGFVWDMVVLAARINRLRIAGVESRSPLARSCGKAAVLNRSIRRIARVRPLALLFESWLRSQQHTGCRIQWSDLRPFSTFDRLFRVCKYQYQHIYLTNNVPGITSAASHYLEMRP